MHPVLHREVGQRYPLLASALLGQEAASAALTIDSGMCQAGVDARASKYHSRGCQAKPLANMSATAMVTWPM